MHWPPRSQDLTLCNFFLWGFVKDAVFVPLVLANVQELCDRITAAVALIDHDMLTRVWNEFDYQLDVCHISQGGHIERLLCMKKICRFSGSVGIKIIMLHEL